MEKLYLSDWVHPLFVALIICSTKSLRSLLHMINFFLRKEVVWDPQGPHFYNAFSKNKSKPLCILQMWYNEVRKKLEAFFLVCSQKLEQAKQKGRMPKWTVLIKAGLYKTYSGYENKVKNLFLQRDKLTICWKHLARKFNSNHTSEKKW